MPLIEFGKFYVEFEQAHEARFQASTTTRGERDHICRHVGDISISRAEDVEIVAEAKRTGETILTHDLGYGHLLAFSGDNAPAIARFTLR